MSNENTPDKEVDKYFSNFLIKSRKISFSKEKEYLYITAIENLLKRINFLELLQENSNKSITYEDFLNEIERNPKKYTIEIESNNNPNILKIISEIVSKIDPSIKELSTSDVSEMFSIQNDKLFKI